MNDEKVQDKIGLIADNRTGVRVLFMGHRNARMGKERRSELRDDDKDFRNTNQKTETEGIYFSVVNYVNFLYICDVQLVINLSLSLISLEHTCDIKFIAYLLVVI